MTTSNDITIDHIKNFFSIVEDVKPLENLISTATGGAGINNLDKFPPPKPLVTAERRKDTDYVAKYLEKARLEGEKKQQSVNLVTGSMYSISGIDDVDDLSTAVGDYSEVNEIDDETTRQIFATYYENKEHVFSPDLSVTAYKDEIIQQLNINPVLIIQGPTGCGKTTQVPQYILDYHAERGKYCNIIVTQPRKIAAMSIARRVCQERKWSLGTLVGYQVAMDPKVSADTRLTYVTTGVLLEKLVAEKNMNKFTHVIIDEVHERDQDIDFALLLVKKFLTTNSQRVKVLLMSATFDTSIFAKYFSLSFKGDDAPVIEISGKSKEVTEHYLHELKTLIPSMPRFEVSEPWIDPCLYDTVVQLIDAFDRIEKKEQNVPSEQDFPPNRGAVLVFLPGYDEISVLSNKLTNARFNKKYWIIPLHSMITLNEQDKVFMNPPVDHRKVIISTNIAESSITVPDVKYVIDFCLTKSLTTDPLTNYTCLQLEWASKANCIQRKGRAGRVSIGKVYRMVPKQFYEGFPEYGIPEIKRCPLTKTILHLKRLNICEPEEMLAFALDPPYYADIEIAVLHLKEALALFGKGSTQEGDLTFIGNVMASLPLDIKLSKLIIFGYAFSCLEECIIIAASLSLQSFFARPFQKALESYRSRLSWADYTFSDCFAYLNAYKVWKQHSVQSFFKKPGGLKEVEWGDKHYIQIKRIKEVDMLVKELKDRLRKHNIIVDVNHQSESNPKSDLILKMQKESDVTQVVLLCRIHNLAAVKEQAKHKQKCIRTALDEKKIVIAGSFFPHYFIQGTLDETEVLREVNENDPLSTVAVSNLPRNQGLLYACALRDMFSCCSDSIDIDFEERKAYIKFERHDISSKIEEKKLPCISVLPAVYLAVKMRLLQMPLELTVFSQEEAENKMKQITLLKKSTSEKQLSSNRYTIKMAPPSTIQRIPLPGPDVILVPIFISHAISCGHFWARYMNPERSQDLRFLELAIFNKEKEKGLNPLRGPLFVNLLCLAPYREDMHSNMQYFRAQVKTIKAETVIVHFVDYGNEEEVKIEELREISDELPDVKSTPALAFECFLSEVKPASSQHHLGVWTSSANSWFKRAVNGVELKAKIYSVVQGTVRLELLKSSRSGTIESINETLVRMGFAERAEEPLLSKQNHEYREKCCAYTTKNVSLGCSFTSMELSLKDALDACSNMKTTSSRIRLKGPYNPLEISYSGITNVDRTKCVKIERDSVNSVSFNPEPQDPHTSMLVAANLTVGQKSDVVHARNTTLMPKIPGLPSLMCLMFSPYAEIRTDKEKKSYTGALCGLGFDPRTGEAMYQDHDVEIEFDIEITLKDICDVNAIRMGLNMLLQTKDEQMMKVSHYRRVLKDYVVNLLQKKRLSREPYLYAKRGQWNQVPETMLLKASVDSTADTPHVLPLHKPPGLNKDADDIA